MQENAAPPPIPDDDSFGYHFPEWLVNLCVTSLEQWHVHPALWFDMPIELVFDIYRHINKRDAIRAGDVAYSNPDAAEQLDFEDMVKVSL